MARKEGNLLSRTYHQIISRRDLWRIVLIDAGFILALVLLGIFFSDIVPTDPDFYKPDLVTFLFGVAFVIVYVSLITLVYSVAKYLVLRELAVRFSLKIGPWRGFVLQNFSALGGLAVLSILFILLSAVFTASVPLAVLGFVVAVIIFLFVYLFFNVMHTVFLLHPSESVADIIALSFRSFRRFGKLSLSFLVLLMPFLILTIIFGGGGWIMRDYLYTKFETSQDFYAVYKGIFSGLFYALLYLAVLYNRFLLINVLKTRR
ncbi:hypothetical protein JW968_00125 [Candidatus Woesearchaeota archaeon]|nr:hypothetical protein [Candidatus Woesearchaeota archaeon]